MPLLALLLIACQIICGLHVVRSGQERYWLYLIIALPGLGCLIYFLGIMAPDLLRSRLAFFRQRNQQDPTILRRRRPADQPLCLQLCQDLTH